MKDKNFASFFSAPLLTSTLDACASETRTAVERERERERAKQPFKILLFTACPDYYRDWYSFIYYKAIKQKKKKKIISLFFTFSRLWRWLYGLPIGATAGD